MGKRNNSQRKENVESPRKEISENEACNMTEKEFRVMVMEFIHRMDEKINNLCKNQEEMKSDIATIKNTMESFNSRLQEAEDRISELEDQVQKQAQAEQQLEKKIKKQEESLRELRDNMKGSNMRIIGLPEGQEEQQGLENLFEEIMTENFPDMGKIKVTQVSEFAKLPCMPSLSYTGLGLGPGGSLGICCTPASLVRILGADPLVVACDPCRLPAGAQREASPEAFRLARRTTPATVLGDVVVWQRSEEWMAKTRQNARGEDSSSGQSLRGGQFTEPESEPKRMTVWSAIAQEKDSSFSQIMKTLGCKQHEIQESFTDKKYNNIIRTYRILDNMKMNICG
ncbi:hypothetical protein QTO34_016095 [Cnephaeus nilssonii]|uniref:Uncharacterized protein n=1 Tax=Cnephaeus nilssonii TaxID=3371016 RepID=A0AA40I5J5_CNENI|nr:hypothetical protein QTO34_016095 [Eptesicus nilssonii]